MTKLKITPALYQITQDTTKRKKKEDSKIYIKISKWNTNKFIPFGYYKSINSII
jgi:hypothetical protein